MRWKKEREREEEEGRYLGHITIVGLNEIVIAFDIVVIHIVLRQETRHIENV